MSHPLTRPGPRGRGTALARAVALLLVLAGLALVVGGGTRLPIQQAREQQARRPLVGATSSVCPVPPEAGSGESPGPTGDPGATGEPATTGDPASTVTAVAASTVAGGTGRLTGTPLGAADAALELTRPGQAGTLTDVAAPVVLRAEGELAAGAAGAVLSTATGGTDAGLAVAPCGVPATSWWFAGVGTTDEDRTELVLTNPDDTQAVVDLRFFGRLGRVAVPGSVGLVVEARSSRVVAVTGPTDGQGPLSVAVRAGEGRVAAAARRVRSDGLDPAGVDWQLPSVAPATTVTVPAVPEGQGARELVVTNPGETRTAVRVEVLGLEGPFAPAGADTVELAPESTATLDLTAGLTGGSGAVRLSGDQPVTGAVVSASERAGAVPGLAVQSAAAPLVGAGVAALAMVPEATSELVLSNQGAGDAATSFTVYSAAGVALRTDDVLLGPGATATRRLTSTAPSYLVVTVPPGSAVVGGVTFSQPDGPVAGLATLPLTSPDVTAGAPEVRLDPAAGR